MMMLSSEGLIKLLDSAGGPLCPQSMPPLNDAHALRVRMLNVAYDASDKDADGDYVHPEVESVATALNYGSLSDRMRLYRDVVTALDTNGTVTIEALFFRCQVCGFVLPAARSPR